MNENITFETASQKWDKVLSFNNQNGIENFDFMGRFFKNNPYVQNSRLKNIKYLPQKYRREELESMLSNPSANEIGLRKASHFFYNTIAPIYKTTNMYADMLTYRTYVNISKVNNINKVEEELATAEEIIRKFNPSKTFREKTLQVIIEGKRFYYKRFDEKNKLLALQELPSDFCQIVGNYEHGYQISFNMMYFMKAGVSVDNFAPEFKDYLQEFFSYYDEENDKMVMRSDVPSGIDIYYNNHNWYFWKTLDIGKGLCFGVDNSEPEITPTLSTLFLDANELVSYKMLEQELLSIPLRQIMTATVPMSKDNKSGSYNNDTAITPELIELYQSIIQQLLPPSVDFVSAPLENFQIHTFDSVSNKDSIVGSAISNFYSQGGISGLISSTDKPNVSMVKTSQVLEGAFIDKIYGQYWYFLNSVIKSLNLKNEFNVVIEGDRFSDVDKLVSTEKDLASGHTYLMPRFLSFKNLDVTTAKATAQTIEKLGLYDMMKPTMSAFQMSAKDVKDGDKNNGRPQKNAEDLANAESAEQCGNLDREVDNQ